MSAEDRAEDELAGSRSAAKLWCMSTDSDAGGSWAALPRRIYLDTSTLQTIFDFGAEIFDGVEFTAVNRASRVEGLADEVDALRRILLVNQRAMFELAVTAASLREVHARHHDAYMKWAYEVAETWDSQCEGKDPPGSGVNLEDGHFGMLSTKDRCLLQEALDWRCQAFLTMERRLPRAAKFLQYQTGLTVLRPTQYWSLLRPWAQLYL